MINKLNYPNEVSECPSIQELVDKINEIIDAVEDLEDAKEKKKEI